LRRLSLAKIDLRALAHRLPAGNLAVPPWRGITVKTAKTLLLVLLALTTVGGFWLAWRQRGELARLRSAAMGNDERAEWQKRVWALERSNRELADQLAAVRAENGDVAGAVAAAAGDAGTDREPRARAGRGIAVPQAAALRTLLARPEVQAMIESQRRFAIEQQYAALFRTLNLPPDQREKLATILANRQVTLQDVVAAAREQGLTPGNNPAAFRQALANAQVEIDNRIRATIGDAGLAQVQSYERTLPQRGVVDQLQQRLLASGEPLTPVQADQLVGILAANSPQPDGGTNPATAPLAVAGMAGRNAELGALAGAFLGTGGNVVLEGNRGAAPVTPASVEQARSILSPVQLAGLQQIEQQQQASQHFRQLVTESLLETRAGSRGAPDGTAAPAAGRGRR
jgi:hypothetical protein